MLALLKNIKEQQDVENYVGEVLVLNNASTESYQPVLDFIQSHPDFPIKYEFSDTNLGVAKGRNRLFKKAKFPYFLVIDDDMEFPDKNAMRDLSFLLEKPQFIQNNTGLITFAVYYFDNGEFQKNTLPHKKYEKYKIKDWFLTYHFAGGANIMRKEVIEKVGDFPEDFFYGMEEYDLSYRMMDAGFTIGYDSSVRVLHKETRTGRVTSEERVRMMWVNKSKVTWRYLPNIYFYTTALMWSFEYLKKTSFNMVGYFKTWSEVLKIPGKAKKNIINNKAMDYLKKVEARLWY